MTKEERKLESKNITIGFDAAKLDALEFVLRKQRSSVQRRMEEVLQQLYEAVREYVDSKSAPAARPRRPAKASVTKQKEGDEHGTA
jgi:cytochrome c oxidase assembly protein Cox11